MFATSLIQHMQIPARQRKAEAAWFLCTIIYQICFFLISRISSNLSERCFILLLWPRLDKSCAAVAQLLTLTGTYGGVKQGKNLRNLYIVR